MSYRDDDDALRLRHDDLVRELEVLEGKVAEHRRVTEELARVRYCLSERQERRGPVRLANLKLATPCKERWEDMVGDARVRVCAGCERPVFNLSEMTMEDAEAVLATRGVTPCVRFYRRADGTVMTSDCPTARRKRRIGVALVTGTFAVVGAAAAIAHLRDGDRIEVSVPEVCASEEPEPEVLTGLIAPEADPAFLGQPEMGKPPVD